MPPELLGDDVEAKRVQMLSEQLQQVSEKLQQTEMALELKQSDREFEQQMKLGELQNENQRVRNETMKAEAQYKEAMAKIEKLEAEAKQAIPAEAIKDIMEAQATAGAELEETVEMLMGRVNELIPEREEEPTGEAENTPEQ